MQSNPKSETTKTIGGVGRVEQSVKHWLHLSSSPSIQVVTAGRSQGFTGQECGLAAELRPVRETLPQRR